MGKRGIRYGCLLLVALTAIGTGFVCRAEDKQQQLTLEKALKVATENSLQRQLALDEVKTAQDKLAQANSGYYPKLNLSGGITRFNELPITVKLGTELADLNNALDSLGDIIKLHNPGDPYYAAFADAITHVERPDQSLTYYGLKLTLELPLYTGNKLESLNKQAQANVNLAKANLETTNGNLACDVKKAYYAVLYMQHMVQTMQEAVSDMEHHVDEANSYFKAGMVPKLDVMRAELKLSDLKQKLLMSENGFILAKSTLNFILGVDLGTNYTLVDDMKYQPLQSSLQTYQSIALTQRPELQAIHAKVEMAKQAVEITKSNARPMVALQASGENVKPYAADPSVSVGLVASVPIYDGGLIQNQVAEAEDVLKQAQTGQELTERGVKLEVEQAYRNVQVALQSIDVAEKSLTQAEETVKMAAVSYKAGLSTSLERIDAEVGLTQAKTNYSQALSMYNIALAQLSKATGTKEDSK